MAGPEAAAKYQTLIFLAGSASAEFFADIGCVDCTRNSISHWHCRRLLRSWWGRSGHTPAVRQPVSVCSAESVQVCPDAAGCAHLRQQRSRCRQCRALQMACLMACRRSCSRRASAGMSWRPSFAACASELLLVSRHAHHDIAQDGSRLCDVALIMCRLFKGLTPLWARQIPCELIVLSPGCCSHVRRHSRHRMQHGHQASP
jgi:hypothetical protein